MKGLSRADFATLAASATVVCIVLPLQTFLGNPGAFPFSFGRLLPELLALFGLFTLGLAVLLAVLKKLAPYFLSLLVAAMVGVFLESGILSFGLPELNGGPVPELANRVRACVDAGVWCVLVLLFVIFARRLRPFLHWIALGVLALAAASLADVTRKTGKPRDASPTTPGNLAFESQPTVVANVKYSPARNILVFILDSTPGKAAVDILATNATLLARFPGFTAYPNNIGMHECTKRGIPGMVTGRHYDPAEISEADYPMTMYSANSFAMTASAAGWNVAFAPDLLPYGATNLPVERKMARVERRRFRERFAFFRRTREIPYITLFDILAFRISPFALKGATLYSRIRLTAGKKSFWSEETTFPILASRPTAAAGRPFLGLFHTRGAHPPWREGLAESVTDAFASLGGLFDAYRRTGLYDRSLIIVAADHGLDVVPPPPGYPPSASALLMVKPEGARAAFGISPAVTSHARIAPLVQAALVSPPDAARCESILRDARPVYRAEERRLEMSFFRTWPE